MVNERRPMGALEAEVMELVWAAPDGLTPREVHDRLGEDLGYTTVMTVLVRLAEKGRLTRTAEGRTFRYAPAASSAEHHASLMASAMTEATDRSEVLATFVDGLDDTDRAFLQQLLRD